MQRQAHVEDRDIDARLVGQRCGDAEQRLGGAVLGPRDQRVGLLAGLDARQPGQRELLHPAIGGELCIKRRRVFLAPVAFEEAAVSIDHAWRRTAIHHAAIGCIGDLRVADIFGKQCQMEHRQRVRPALRPYRRDIGNRSRLVAHARRRPAVEQSNGQRGERALGREADLMARAGKVMALERYHCQRQPPGAVVRRYCHDLFGEARCIVHVAG